MNHVKDNRVHDRMLTVIARWRTAGLLAVLMVAMAILLGPSSLPVRAADFVVDTTDDTVDINPGDGSCFDGVEPFPGCSLRAAIMEANALPGADTISVPAGTYILTITGTGEDASATGDLDISEDVNITGAGIDNTKIDGGALDRVFHVISGTVNFSAMTITNGQTFNSGGGVFIEPGAVLNMSLSSVTNSEATGGGGLTNGGTTTIDQSTFSGNSGIEGSGGIGNFGSLTLTRSAVTGSTNGGVENDGSAQLTNVTLSGNDFFGALTYSGTMTIEHATIASNSGDGVVAPGGAITLYQTIIADNTNDCSFGTITSLGYNLFKDGADAECNALAIGSDLTGVDPLLAALADNGGATRTHAISPAGAAYNAGDPTFTPPPATDQRGPGFDRVLGGTVDIGAFELLPGDTDQLGPTFLVNTVDDPGDGVCTMLHCSLREAINAANTIPNSEGEDWIEFNIPDEPPTIIQPGSALPAITEPLFIEAALEAGQVILDGSLAGADVPGLTFANDGNRVRHLEIRNFDGPGVLVSGGSQNRVRLNSIHDNGGLGIDLGDPELGTADGVTPNDYGDGDSGPNDLLNRPVLQRVINDGGNTLVQGFIFGPPSTTVTIDLYSNTTCDSSFYGEGETYLDTIASVDIPAEGYQTFTHTLPAALPNGTGVAAVTTSLDSGSSEFSNCSVAGANNDSWPNALEILLEPVSGGLEGGTIDYITQPSQSRWFRFPVAPNSTVIVDLTNLPTNYDLILFKDIAKAYEELTAPADLDDLVELNAEFAPEMFAPEMFAPEMFAPEMFAPEMFAPEMFAPEMFAPEMFAPEMFAPEMFAPGMLSPGQIYFSSAQTQSMLAVSGYDGTADETVAAGSWSESGDFYVRVTGRNGVFNPTAPFTLGVTVLGEECLDLKTFEFTPDTSGISPGDIENLILVDTSRMVGPEYGDLTEMQAALAELAAETNGAIVELSEFKAINEANDQADSIPQCVFAKNLVAYAIKDIVDAYRAGNPIENVVVVGNDSIIPFFRYPDQGLLANEDNYEPPVQDLTSSQASLRLGYVLSQDAYGTDVEIDRRNTSLPIPQIPVGRLVELPWEITNVVNTFLDGDGVVSNPAGAFQALVTGYDFLDDGATAVQDELQLSLDTDGSTGGLPGTVNSLISAATVAPAEAWTADELRAALLESGRHDLVYLAGHFSAGSTLAADYETRLLASEVAGSIVDMSNIIVFSAGCHSGYNIVNEHDVPRVSFDPDWAQAFAQKGALLIAGTGYQYGDTDFVEYSERLYREFTEALREGNGPVTAGEALVRAKQIYLADTAQMRPIHEKVLLQSTIFGLPMLSIDVPGGRGPQPGELSIVTPPLADFGTNPGLELNLQYADVTVAPSITPNVKILENVVEGEPDITTTFYEGDDGLVINPGEPVRPLDQFNVSVLGTVLRGIGFRGGSYNDQAGVVPLTGAATTEIRGIHTPFISDVFFPIVPWEANYFDALANSADEGETRMAVIPAQYRSAANDAINGTLRTFDNMSFRLYYSANLLSYYNSEADVTNVPALASPPVINSVLAQENGGDVDFSVEVTGDPSAGIQEVWVTYTALSGPYAGQWQPLDLSQDSNESTLWTGSLPLNGTAAEDMRFMVQAANGVGLVSLATNKGAYYTPNINPGDPPTPPGDLTPADPVSTMLTLSVANPASGIYGTEITVSAELLDEGGSPLEGKRVEFGLTTQRISAQTDADGIATTNLTIISEPVEDILRVSFDGDSSYAAAADAAPFEILPIATQLVLETETPTFNAGGSADITIALTDATGRPLREKTVLVVADDGINFFGEAVITNLYGNAVVRSIDLPVDDSPFIVNAYFGSVQTVNGVDVDLTNPRYLASSTSLQLIENTPPVADAAGPYTVDEGSTVELDGSASSDVDTGQALTYFWDLDNNGSFETEGLNPSFSAAGLDGPTSATVGLQVCDPVDDCSDNTAMATINIENAPPEIQEVGNTGPVDADEAVAVYVVASDAIDPITYAFDCDNDNIFEIGPQLDNAAECSFSVPGAHVVNVKVEDDDGGGATDSTIVQVSGSEPLVYLSLRTKGDIEGLQFTPDDILVYDGEAESWALYFDASDVGVGKNNLQAFTILDNGHLLLNFARKLTIPGVGQVDDYDIVRFVPTSLGGSTAGSFELYLDGADVGLTAGGERIDALAHVGDKLIISTSGKFSVPGVISTIRGQGQDLLMLNDRANGGQWSLYLDGAEVGLETGSEDIKGVAVNPASGEIYLNTQSDFVVDGAAGTARDIFACSPTDFDPVTACTFSLLWNGPSFGLGDYKPDGIQIKMQ